MRSRSFEILAATAAALFCASSARAEEVIYGPDGAPTVVQHKLYTMTGRFEVGLNFDIALNTALVDQMGGVLGISYHPAEWLDLGVEGLLNHASLSNLSLNVRAVETGPRTPGQCVTPPFLG